jgi:predicted branched-subunit amino acid permease
LAVPLPLSLFQQLSLTGIRDAIPLLGAYTPVAISFGLIAIQAGFSTWEANLISVLIYAGASQFLFVGMVASGAPLWLVVVVTLLINVRHVIYASNLAPWLTRRHWWPWPALWPASPISGFPSPPPVARSAST